MNLSNGGRGLLPSMHSRLLALMITVSVCFLVATGVIMWSMRSMEKSLSATVVHSQEELVPVMHLEGDVRKAELAGWTAAFAVYQGAPLLVRGEYDAIATRVTEEFAIFHAAEGGDLCRGGF